MSDLSKTCSRLGDRAAGRVMQATMADLNGYWLELQCGQHGTVMLPVRLMIERGYAGHRAGAVLGGLRCKICSQPPARAWLTETHNRAFHHGAPPGWSVQLIPAAIAKGDEAAE